MDLGVAVTWIVSAANGKSGKYKIGGHYSLKTSIFLYGMLVSIQLPVLVIWERAVKETGLDGRQRDKDGKIRQKSGNTLVSTLRKEYGENFAKGYAPSTKLSELLAKEACSSLHEFLHRGK